MRFLYLFLFERKHFVRNRAKVVSYLLFVCTCVYALQNGLDLYHKQSETISEIQQSQVEDIQKVNAWFEEGKNGPEDRSWVDIHEPYWALRYTPTYVIKSPSSLLPLGLGQSEQFGYYKEITFWSSTYDNDMVEEIANPERLGNGTLDFAFLILYLFPLLLIVLTYDIGGVEKDEQFDSLIRIQYGSWTRWIAVRMSFYVSLLLITVLLLMSGVVFSNTIGIFFPDFIGLLYLVSGYVLAFALLYFVILRLGNGSNLNAFNLIGTWIVLCILIPGAVHQYISLKIPSGYMTEFLDANRKEAYAVYSLPSEIVSEKLVSLYPSLESKIISEEEQNGQHLRKSLSALTNELNKSAVEQIELRNAKKNELLHGTYWFNPVMFAQNKWNSYTSSDYDAYLRYRLNVQQKIDQKLDFLVLDTWNERTTEQSEFQVYIQALQ